MYTTTSEMVEESCPVTDTFTNSLYTQLSDQDRTDITQKFLTETVRWHLKFWERNRIMARLRLSGGGTNVHNVITPSPGDWPPPCGQLARAKRPGEGRYVRNLAETTDLRLE